MAALPPLNDRSRAATVLGPSRRGLLLGSAGIAAAALAGCGEEVDPGEPIVFERSVERIGYADDHADQHGFFGVPAEGSPRALAVLIHGGYWFQGFGAALMDAAAADLRGRGFATWHIEYRRTDLSGSSPGGYPNTFRDVAAAIDHIPDLPLAEQVPVVVIGHSAGGQLAAWAASRTQQTPGGASAVELAHAFVLSGVLDMATGEKQKLGNGAVTLLMGGSAAAFPTRYDLGDPTRLVPASCPVTVIHAADDTYVPTSQSTSYVAADKAAGGKATFLEVAGDHLGMVRPGAGAWQAVRDGLDEQFPR